MTTDMTKQQRARIRLHEMGKSVQEESIGRKIAARIVFTILGTSVVLCSLVLLGGLASVMSPIGFGIFCGCVALMVLAE